jgi:hypothetical protein
MADAVSKPAAPLEVSMDRCPASSMDVKKQQLPPPLAVVVWTWMWTRSFLLDPVA